MIKIEIAKFFGGNVQLKSSAYCVREGIPKQKAPRPFKMENCFIS
jgi:hypothetical protein